MWQELHNLSSDKVEQSERVVTVKKKVNPHSLCSLLGKDWKHKSVQCPVSNFAVNLCNTPTKYIRKNYLCLANPKLINSPAACEAHRKPWQKKNVLSLSLGRCLMGQAALQLVQTTSGSLAHPEILVLFVPRVWTLHSLSLLHISSPAGTCCSWTSTRSIPCGQTLIKIRHGWQTEPPVIILWEQQQTFEISFNFIIGWVPKLLRLSPIVLY